MRLIVFLLALAAVYYLISNLVQDAINFGHDYQAYQQRSLLPDGWDKNKEQ